MKRRWKPWVWDIRVKIPNENIAELQDITVAKLGRHWRYWLHITKKQRRAADKYHGLWTHARRWRTWKAAAPAGRRAEVLSYDPSWLTDFSRAARRDDDLVAACGLLLGYMEQRDRRWLWCEARKSLGRYANHVDNILLYGHGPLAQSVEDSWIGGLRLGLNGLVEFFEAKRKLDYEAGCLDEHSTAISGESRDEADSRRSGAVLHEVYPTEPVLLDESARGKRREAA